MKKVITSGLLFVMFTFSFAQEKYWLSGYYSNQILTYFRNGVLTKTDVDWEPPQPTNNTNVVLYGSFKTDDNGAYFAVENANATVNLYNGTAVIQKVSCPLPIKEGTLTFNTTKKSLVFASFVNFPQNANIVVTKADWGVKNCGNKLTSVYYIQEISGNNTETPANNPTTQSNTNTITATGSQVTTADAQLALNLHNKIRAEVGVAPLSWSAKLSEYAQQWANYQVSLSPCGFDHRPTSGPWKRLYGENLAWLSSPDNAISESVNMWHEEKKDFNNTNWLSAGHYSQIVWRKTTQVGMGIAKCRDGSILVVANYDPAGNMMGENAY